MTQVNQALYQLCRTLGLPVFRTGCVPVAQPAPYLVLEPVMGAPFETAVVTLESWHASPGGTQAAADMLDRVAALLPPSGLLLPVGTGHLVLYRARGAWQSYVQDKNNPSLVGGRSRCEVHFHLTEGA